MEAYVIKNITIITKKQYWMINHCYFGQYQAKNLSEIAIRELPFLLLTFMNILD